MKHLSLLFFSVFLSGIMGIYSSTEAVTNSSGELSEMIPQVTATPIGSTGMQGSPRWVTQGGDGWLRYATNNKGDRIPDFSHAGYGGGGVKIPDVPVQKTVSPSAGDDSSAIQEAVNAVGAMPLKDGFRGAVMLSPGIFHCSNTITLFQDGVVLRGSGTNAPNGTTIIMAGSPHSCLIVQGGGKASADDCLSTVPVTDDYIPCGATNLTVMDSSGFRLGDPVIIKRTLTKEWIHFMGMDLLVRDGKPQTWIKENSVANYERNIQAIEGNCITLDVPIPDAVDARFMTPPTGTIIAKFSEKNRLSRCGLESFRIKSSPPTGNLTAPNNVAVRLIQSEDCWVKDLFMDDVLNDIKIDGGSRRVTVKGVTSIHSTKLEGGKGAPGDFNIMGSQVLIDRCNCSGDGAFFVTTLDQSSTLNVVLYSNFHGKGGIQPHMRWSTAMLLDNCSVPDGKIAFHNRGTCGSGQGWAMGWGVIWNCAASTFLIQQPPGVINWCIGCTGDVEEKRQKGKRKALPISQASLWLDSLGVTVIPQSLYLAQLRDRLGEQAIKNIGY